MIQEAAISAAPLKEPLKDLETVMGINQMVDTIAAPGEKKRSSLIAQFRSYSTVFAKVRTAVSVSQKSLLMSRADSTHSVILSKLERILKRKLSEPSWITRGLDIQEVGEKVIFLNNLGTQSRT